MWVPSWVEGLRLRLYVLFMNRLYTDECYQALGQAIMRVAHRIDKRVARWSE
jgi:NADH-quinone oxidoreductase subunit L